MLSKKELEKLTEEERKFLKKLSKKRDQFAKAAMTGLLAKGDYDYIRRDELLIVKSYRIADLMLLERETLSPIFKKILEMNKGE